MTALLGLAVLASAARIARDRRAILVTRAAAAGVLVIAGGFALRVWLLPESYSYGPQVGFVATMSGGLIALLGARASRASQREAG